ncbi:MAG: serine O-acetyltransferase EpsC [Verrucomicrobiia bacterium]
MRGWKSRLNRGPVLGYGGRMAGVMEGLKEQLLDSYAEIGGINHIDGANLPSKRAVARITEELLHLMFPGFFRETCLTQASLESTIGNDLEAVRKDLVREVGKSLEFEVPEDLGAAEAKGATEAKVEAFLGELPRIRSLLGGDVEAAYEGDPAAKSFEEIILAYPGIEAVAVQRLAHELYRLGVALIPRMMTEWAHARTGIDIHPGARIGERFFIDHGTGVVVGETCEIGNRVKIYHGVTLGARSTSGGQSLRAVKRHPTIEDDVTIYSGAVILGGETRIGKGSMIGGNVFLLESVPPNSVVYYDEHSVVIRPRGHYEPDFMI